MRLIFSKIHQILSPGERKWVLVVAVFSILAALVQVTSIASIMPFLAVLANQDVIHSNAVFSWFYDYFGFPTPNRFLLALGALVFLALLAGIAVNAGNQYLSMRFGNRCNAELSRRMLIRYLERPYAFFLTRNSSELSKNIFAEVGQVVGGIINPGIHILSSGITVGAVMILLIAVEPLLAVSVAVILGAAYTSVFYAVRRKLTRYGFERIEANRERFKAASEAFGGIKDIKLLGREEIYTGRFTWPSRKLASIGVKTGIISQMPRFAMEAFAFGGMMLIILYLLVSREEITRALPLLGLYAMAGYKMMPMLQHVFHSLTTIRSSLPVLDSVYRELFDEMYDGDAIPFSSRDRLPLRREIALRDVTFHYPNANKPVLDRFSLSIKAGGMVGLVGVTGSGKTTTVDIILGLLRPEEGSLTVDGVPVEGDLLRRWQNSLGYVSQHIYLADESITANIAFGVPPKEVDPERVRQCARDARIDLFIEEELPRGYDTLVGERGVRLSGGQRQRIGIARALYHDPEVLVLDEATSALDNMTEQEVMDAIHGLEKKKTIIIIAHRLSTVRRCERIYLLEKGMVVGDGNYEQLIQSNRKFQKMAGVTT